MFWVLSNADEFNFFEFELNILWSLAFSSGDVGYWNCLVKIFGFPFSRLSKLNWWYDLHIWINLCFWCVSGFLSHVLNTALLKRKSDTKLDYFIIHWPLIDASSGDSMMNWARLGDLSSVQIFCFCFRVLFLFLICENVYLGPSNLDMWCALKGWLEKGMRGKRWGMVNQLTETLCFYRLILSNVSLLVVIEN